MEQILEWGITLVLYLQGLGDWLVAPMSFITFLGNEEFYLLVMPAFYWCINPAVGLRLGVLLLMSSSLNSALKLLGHGPRPFWYSPEVRAYAIETSFGLPSGHSMNAVSIWGGLAASLRRLTVWAAAAGLIFLIGISRLFLGVHFPSDVLTGWAAGAVFLVIFFKLERPVLTWYNRLSWGAKLGAGFALSLSLVALGVLLRLTLSAWTLPEIWLTNAALADPAGEPLNPTALSSLVSKAGALFGIVSGAVLIQMWGGYHEGGPSWKWAARFLVGVVGVVMIWRGVGMLLPGGESLAGLTLRYAHYALIGLWIGGLAPALFKLTGLAEAARAAPSASLAT